MESKKQQEIKKTLKVHANLLKLNNYCKKKILHQTGVPQGNTTAGGVFHVAQKSQGNAQTRNLKIKQRKNVTVVHDDHRQRYQRFNESENDIVNELTITPNRMLFEESEPSLNVSANPPRLSRDGTAARTHKDVSRLTHETQDLYEDSKM